MHNQPHMSDFEKDVQEESVAYRTKNFRRLKQDPFPVAGLYHLTHERGVRLMTTTPGRRHPVALAAVLLQAVGPGVAFRTTTRPDDESEHEM